MDGVGDGNQPLCEPELDGTGQAGRARSRPSSSAATPHGVVAHGVAVLQEVGAIMSRSLVALVALGVSLVGLVACGPNCQNTCDQVYNACSIDKPGQTKSELLGSCNDECNSALQNSGDLGEYDPFARRSSSQSITLENEAQAAAWMDCVWFYAPDATPEQCADLDPSAGFCAPI